MYHISLQDIFNSSCCSLVVVMETSDTSDTESRISVPKPARNHQLSSGIHQVEWMMIHPIAMKKTIAIHFFHVISGPWWLLYSLVFEVGHVKWARKTRHEQNQISKKRGADVWQWKMDPVKMYFLLKMGMFHCYVSLPEGKWVFLVLPLISGLYWWSNCTLTIDRFSAKWMPCSQMPWLIRGWLMLFNRPSCWFGMMIEYWLLKFTMFIMFLPFGIGFIEPKLYHWL